MPHVRDAEDALNVQTGDFAALLAPYLEIIRQRCLIAVRDGHGDDVAQNVYLRLLREHQAGKRYRVPYRVVVHKVVDWTIKEHFQGLPTDVPLPDDFDPAGDESGFGELEDEDELAQWFAELSEGERRVCELRYLRGLEPDEIADELGMTRNAVDQRLFQARKRLREIIGGG
jgi:RNA polymerase sigma factor (sigma-70 family)